ncbi:MAG: HPr-rel-A system PqqD family peptide chaperone [Gammaproteobacteria bacterium]|nr:HPr-rel-A system PqqD family peptide chaperone [Gammaproteobacteria bacterium]
MWVATDPSNLLWEEWKWDYAVFNPCTGQTHYLDPLPAEILRLVCQTPHTTHTISKYLAAESEVECDTVWKEKITSLVKELYRLDLIEPAN